MKKVRVLCLALFVLCSFGTARAAEPVRIGVIAPLTGSQANSWDRRRKRHQVSRQAHQ